MGRRPRLSSRLGWRSRLATLRDGALGWLLRGDGAPGVRICGNGAPGCRLCGDCALGWLLSGARSSARGGRERSRELSRELTGVRGAGGTRSVGCPGESGRETCCGPSWRNTTTNCGWWWCFCCCCSCCCRCVGRKWVRIEAGEWFCFAGQPMLFFYRNCGGRRSGFEGTGLRASEPGLHWLRWHTRVFWLSRHGTRVRCFTSLPHIDRVIPVVLHVHTR